MRRLVPWVCFALAPLALACGSDKKTATDGDGSANGGGSPMPGGSSAGGAAGGVASAGQNAGGCVHGPYPSPDIFDASCAFDHDAYIKLSQSLSTDDGLSYRFGPDATFFHPTTQDLPTLPRVQVRVCGNGAIQGPPPQVLLYELGDACDPTNPGNYSSDQGIVLYRSDVPIDANGGSGGASTAAGGVDNIQIEGFGYNSFYYLPSESPDLGGPLAGQVNSDAWTTLAGGPVHAPIAVGRGIAPPFGQTSQVGYVLFNDGLIGTIGTNTENGGLVTSLPAGLVPTAVGVTNGSEFLLVTVWDTTTVTSKLAVFSIESDHAGSGDFDDTFYDFHQHLPGFPSTGDATTLKLLGLVDLPGMIAPTDIAVASNYQSAFFQQNGNAVPAKVDLTQQATWQTFTNGGENATQRSTGGFAVVSSRSENKVAFIDLQPLFDAFNAAYFTTFDGFMQTQNNWGPAPNQWPPTFDTAPSEAPVVVSTIATSQMPTTLFAGRTGQVDASKGIHALVATVDGTLHIFDVGGLIDSSAVAAADIQEIGAVSVGKNPTNIAIRKAGSASVSSPDPVSGSTGDLEGTQVFVVCRGDREIDFVEVDGATGKVFAKLQDAELIDPVTADDADHESFLSYVLDVADLKGRQIVSYRYGPVTFPSDMSVYPLPTGADGKPVFECGGSYSVRGTPFAVSGTNVP